jgi:hypothetical protein
MNKLLLGMTLTLGLLLGASTITMASPGDGLNRDAAATGNSNMGEMHRNAAGGSMMGRRMRSAPPMHRRHHHRRSRY